MGRRVRLFIFYIWSVVNSFILNEWNIFFHNILFFPSRFEIWVVFKGLILNIICRKRIGGIKYCGMSSFTHLGVFIRISYFDIFYRYKYLLKMFLWNISRTTVKYYINVKCLIIDVNIRIINNFMSKKIQLFLKTTNIFIL